MATFTAENRTAWQKIADAAAPQRPSVGKIVTVTSGKHAGTTGKVTWHGIDRFASIRYCDDARLALREINGREGYRIKIVTDDGDSFLVNAEKVTVGEAQ